MHSINPDAARAGGMVMTPVAPVVRDVVAVMRSRNEGAKVSLHVTGNGTRAAIAPNDLRSVVTNLVSNAIQATGGAGPVSVTVRTDVDAVTITVADRGPGLPDGDVFEAFYTTKSSGTGLGLWLVRRLVEDAGGSIASGSRRGGGAVFTVKMPLPRHGRLRDVPILLIEDEAPLRRASTEALERCGAASDCGRLPTQMMPSRVPRCTARSSIIICRTWTASRSRRGWLPTRRSFW